MKNLYLLLIQIMLFCLPAPDLAAQVASYHFDGTPTDELGGTDPTYIIREVNSDASGITYTSGVDDQAVYLDSASGFVLPMEVTDALMSSNVWSFQMRFKVTDHGDGDGQRMLINLKRGGTGSAPYFRVFSTKDSDTQGRVVFQMNNGEESASQFAFYFDLDEWVNLSLLIDFAEGFYTLTGDNYFVSSNFTDFDYERFKTYGDPNSLENIRFRIGYYQELGRRQANPAYKTAYTSDLVIDELTISNTHPETDVSVYENALQQLTNHLNGSTSLSAEEISTYTAQALTNFKDNYPTSKAIVDAYFDAYENVHEPMFMGESGVSIYEDYDEFGWVLFNLQLDVFDNYVSSENIDDVDGMVFETSIAFPGPVAETAERVTDQNFTINGTYLADPGYNKKILEKGYGDIARRGTGYYAAPGERITVTVPNELAGIGAQVVIGTFTHDVSNKTATGLRRFPRAIKEFEIVQTNTDAISPLGGIIYIYIPEGADLGDLDLSISGAVKFAYYEQSSTNTGDITDFQTRLESAEVLLAEVVTDNFMYTGPLAYFKFDDTMQTLETWDNMWEAYQLYNGRPFPLHKAEHLVHDKMTKWNTLAGGYPMNLAVGSVPYVDDFWGSTAKGHMMNILEFDKAIHDNKATYWHEMSHHTGLPTLPWEVECIVELAYAVTNHLGNNMPLDSAFKYASRGFRTRDAAIVDWVVMEEFRTNEEMTKTQRQYQQRGYSKYVDVGALFGWEALGSINKVFYDYWASIGGQTNDPELNIITDTEWILASCEALNVNVAPLYHFWGEQPNDTIMAEVNNYPRSEEVYLRLREIRDFIPKTVEDFQPYFDAHAPSNTNSQNYQPYQDALVGWNTNLLYDSIIAQVDSILYQYYDGDFDQDGYVFTADLDDLDPLVNTIEGTYIIGSSDAADYPSFTEAITNLRTIEITGDVTYSVESGTYNETVNLSSINNGEHTITFRGTDKATTIIHPLDSIPSDKSGISIFGTNNIVLKNFTLEMDNISSTKVIADSNESKGINISNASNINLGDLVFKNDGESFDLESRTHFIATSISLVDVSDVTISGCFFSMAGVHTWIDDFINVNISNNSFQQGQYHVRNKQSENVDGSGLLIDNNTMTGPMEGGIDIMGFDDHQLIEGVIVRNNILNGIEHADRVYYNAPQERYNGIDLYNTIGAMVHHNTVDTRFGMGTYNNESLTVHSNIFLSSEDAFGNYVGEGNTGTVIYNNFFEGYVSIDFPVDTKFVHNTLVEQDRYSVFSFYYPTGENNIVANNIFLGTDVETLIFLYLERDIEVGLIWDYNLYYVRMDDGTSEPWLITRAVDASDPEMPDPDASDSFSNLSEWQAFQTDFDHNSQSFSPEFVKSNDYHIADPNDYRFGAYFESITNDIDGDLRLEAIGIDVGADQHCGNEQSVVVETCDSFEFDESILIESGEYSASLLSRNGCDSLVNLSLTIFESFQENVEVEVCESYTFNNEPLTASGEYEALFESQYGCDSLVNLSLTILPVFEESVEVSVCDSFEFNESILIESGEYSASLLSQHGCDSLVNLSLTILESFQETVEVEVCESYTFNNEPITSSGEYQALFESQYGCDSLVNLSLTILPVFEESVEVSVCDSYEFDDSILIESGEYSASLLSRHGCDSLVNLSLTILESFHETVEVEVCESYTFNNEPITSSGEYEALFESQYGCDSLVSLSLTILPVFEESVEVSVCDSYEFNESILIESGEYSASLLSRHGCDSLVNLSLTILESFQETVEVEVCESYTFNNEPITSSGEYEALFESMTGCDSLVNLSLTILPVFEESVEVSVCDAYEFNNQLLSESGQYSASLLSQNGCDSLVNLDLNILAKDQVDINESVCHSYIFDGIEIFASGQYSAIFTNQTGCDSLVNLSLTIFEEPSSDITMNGIVLFAEAKEGATYQWIDCSTNEPIEGETKRQLTPPRSGSYSVRISNENCTVVSECVESVVLSVKDEIAKSVKVYPNPTTGLLHLDLNARYGEVTIEVFNVSGQLKKSRKYLATKKIELDMSDQVSGIYFVHLRTLGSIDQIIKIIKK